MGNIYAASWDRTAWIISAIFIIALIGGGICLILGGVRFLTQSKTTAYLLILLGVCFIVGCIATAFFAPVKYRIDPEGIAVLRIGKAIRVSKAEIVDLRVVPGDTVFRDSIRTCASGGAFGYFGSWKSPELGPLDVYSTRTDRVVVIKRKAGAPVVLSPDEPDKFVETARRDFSIGSDK